MDYKSVVLFDDNYRSHLFPFTLSRSTASLRVGIWTIREKWESALSSKSQVQSESYLQPLYGEVEGTTHLYINGAACPSEELVSQIGQLKPGEALTKDDQVIAFIGNQKDFNAVNDLTKIAVNSSFSLLRNTWDIFTLNERELINDLEVIKQQRSLASSSDKVKLTGNDLYIEEGAELGFCYINTEDGPVYIGKNASIMDGAMITGPFALLDNSVLKMGAKIYGGTTIGPHCKVGGEVNNSVIFGYSNKAHEGFLGNSVIGEWCNLGADTNNSNLKNNYGLVDIWDYHAEKNVSSKKQFCGLLMGDHSKCAINTQFNTGTVVGVFANIFGVGFPPKFIPSFTWGGYDNSKTYLLRAAIQVAKRVMQRRDISFTETDQKVIEHIFEMTSKYRDYE